MLKKSALPKSRRRRTSAPASRPPLLRMMKIHDLLAAERFPNCSTLAEELEVSTKTIQRDIDFMRDQMELPIDYDQVRHGFHYTEPVGQFPMVKVTHGEIVALLVAQKALVQYQGTAFEKPLRNAFEKLTASLDSEASVSWEDLSEAFSFHPASASQIEMKTFEAVSSAALNSVEIEFSYQGLHRTKAETRRVQPYHLACINNQWYLLANDLVRGGMRTFALTRVSKVHTLASTFKKPANFSPQKLLEGSFSAFEAQKVETVRLRLDATAARLVAERRWHKSQKLEPLELGGAILTMQVGIAPDLESWILGWGGRAEVLEPDSLRQTIAEAARATASRYA